MEHVIAEWGGKTYPAIVNEYRVATILAGTKPLSNASDTEEAGS